MSYPTFNGWTIINPPATPGFKGVVLRMNDTVAETRSPFTATSQVQIWPGADWWEAEIEMPPMLPRDTAPWQAWLASLQGKGNAFQLGDTSRRKTLNPVVGSAPVCATGTLPSAVNLVGSSSLVTRGWKFSQARILLPGDYIQVGYRLHIVLQSVTSDSSGNATINIWPSLREQPVDEETVILENATGLFRLAENARQVSVAVTRMGSFGFKCVEAR